MQLLRSDDIELKLNALWAYKNLLYKASPELKREVMGAIGCSEMSKWVDCPASLFTVADSQEVCYWSPTRDYKSKFSTSCDMLLMV